MSRPILEVIALSTRDAVAAWRGGADRLEIAAGMADGGLTPDPSTVAEIRDAVDLPVRVMVRCNSAFGATPAELAAMLDQVAALRSAGAQEFVFGLLTPAGEVDLAACRAFAAVAAGCPWTFHRAIDHAADRRQAWAAVRTLPGIDTVLTAGSPAGVAVGIGTLAAESAESWTSSVLLAGGGLKDSHLPMLHAAGVRQVHVGSPVRRGSSWTAPVDEREVSRWRSLLDAWNGQHRTGPDAAPAPVAASTAAVPEPASQRR